MLRHEPSRCPWQNPGLAGRSYIPHRGFLLLDGQGFDCATDENFLYHPYPANLYTAEENTATWTYGHRTTQTGHD